MTALLWGIFSVMTSSWLAPFAGALIPLSLPLPQDTNWVSYSSARLLSHAFSTNPRDGRIAAELDSTPALTTFITNNQSCVRQSEDLSYRVMVRNRGAATAQNVTVQFQYPQTTSFRDSDPKPSQPELPDTRLIEWRAENLPPGATTAYSIIVNIQAQVENVTVNVTVFYTDDQGQLAQTLTSHAIDGPCGESPAPAQSERPNKQPAIVCEKDEIGQSIEQGCADTFQNLDLGKNYQRVLEAPDYRAKELLGKRFAEAYADIVPGECRVAADDIITDPAFHDALNRRAKPAARFLRPLYDSGQDYRQFILENELYAIPHFLYVRSELMKTQDQNWQEHIDAVRVILNEKKSAAGALAEFDQQTSAWHQRIEDLHEAFFQDYQQLQRRKKDSAAFTADACTSATGRFSIMACQAIRNAEQSTLSACGPPPSDGGLKQSLPAVYNVYDTTLNNRQNAYSQTQNDSIAAYQNFIARRREAFMTVLQQSSSNNKKPLEDYLRNVANASTGAFTALLTPYEQHKKTDASIDDTLRLQQWEVALDAPKTAATTCEKENIFPPSVATSWCESGSSPELIIQEAPKPAKARTGDIQPPAPIAGGQQAIIRQSEVRGNVCGEQPGDPHWALNCKCKCDDLVPCGGTLYLCQDLYTCTFDPLDRIERHDIYVTSQEECFWDGSKHEDPFF